MKFIIPFALLLAGSSVYAQKTTIDFKRNYFITDLGQITTRVESEGNMATVRNKYGTVLNSYQTGTWKFFHKSGNLYSQGEYKEGKQEGAWTYFYDIKGSPVQEVSNFKANKRTGTAKQFYPEGQLYREFDYDKGMKNGNFIQYADGKKTVEGQYTNDLRTGKWTIRSNQGVLLQTVHYDNGIAEAFYPSGKKKSLFRFFFNSDESFGFRDYVLFYENGNKRLEGKFNEKQLLLQETTLFQKNSQYGSYDAGLMDDLYTGTSALFDGWAEPVGIWKSYWEDGSVATENNFDTDSVFVRSTRLEEKFLYKNSNGNYGRGEKVLSEFHTEYNKDGIPFVQLFIGKMLDKRGDDVIPEMGVAISPGGFLRIDEWELFDSAGRLLSKATYDFIYNRMRGPYISYYRNGKVKSEGAYDENSKRTGTWRFYFEDGKLQQECPYVDGKITGVVTNYFSNGKRLDKCAWVDGKQVGVMELYHPNGQLLGYENYKDGKFINHGDFFDENSNRTMQNGTGYRVAYFANGVVSYKGNWLNQRRQGLNQWFFENSKPKEEGNYESGQLQGSRVFYFEKGGIMSKEMYINGKVDGAVQNYHPNGKISGTLIYKDGNLTRPEDFFDENGNNTLSNGSGVQIIYNNKGIIIFRCNFLNYCRQGLAQWYHDNGQLQQEVMYKYSENNKPFGLRWEVLSCLDSNGKKLDCGTLSGGNGTWHTYDNNGKKTTTQYVNGLPKQ